MPRYEFRCRACGDTFIVNRPMSGSGDPAACPQGHNDTVKLLNTIGLAGGGAVSINQPASGGGGGACCGGGCCG